MTITLKEIIENTKEYDKDMNVNTDISVYLTAVGKDNKRHRVTLDPKSKNFMDRMTLTCFEDCTVSDVDRFILSDTEHLLIVIVDIEKQFGGDK